MIRAYGDGKLANLTKKEAYGGTLADLEEGRAVLCRDKSPDGLLFCTRPPHSRLTLHAGAYVTLVGAVWADEEAAR